MFNFILERDSMGFDDKMFDVFEKTYYSPEGAKDFAKTAKILNKPKKELELYYIMVEYEERIGDLKKKLENAEKGIRTQELVDPKYIDTNYATKLLKDTCNMSVTKKTLLTWLVQYQMGRKIGGRWIVYREKFMKFLEEGVPGVK